MQHMMKNEVYKDVTTEFLYVGCGDGITLKTQSASFRQ